MTIETQINKVQYEGDGAAVVFPVPFPVLDETHLRLFLWDGTAQTEMTSGFTVQGAGTSAVSVLAAEPVAPGFRLTILRQVPFTQPMDLENGGDFNAETLEDSADHLVMQIQQLKEEVDRSVKVAESFDDAPINLQDLVSLRDEAEQAAGRAESAASSSLENAAEAREAAGEAAEIAKSLAGFANAVQTFVGLRLEGFTLYQDKTGDGDEVNASDYLYLTVLPIESNFKINGGALSLEVLYGVPQGG